MGIIILPGGGGGGGELDVITAGVSDIRAGKVIVDKDGNPLTGTQKDNGTWNSSGLAAGGSVTIPAGIHSGSGKVTAKSLSEQTQGNLTAAAIRSGYYGYSNGSKVTGSMGSMGAQTVTPSGSAKTVACKDKYMTGNIVVSAVANLSAGNIKKGAVVGGVTGTFQGYVTRQAIFYYGTWTIGGGCGTNFYCGCSRSLDSNSIYWKLNSGSGAGGGHWATVNKIDLSKYRYITFYGTNLDGTTVAIQYGTFTTSSSRFSGYALAKSTLGATGGTFSLASTANAQLYFGITNKYFSGNSNQAHIYSIVLS